eukprot:c12285_g1_i1 orf=25-429(-)
MTNTLAVVEETPPMQAVPFAASWGRVLSAIRKGQTPNKHHPMVPPPNTLFRSSVFINSTSKVFKHKKLKLLTFFPFASHLFNTSALHLPILAFGASTSSNNPCCERRSSISTSSLGSRLIYTLLISAQNPLSCL